MNRIKNNETIFEIKRILGFKDNKEEFSNEVVIDEDWGDYPLLKIKIDDPAEFDKELKGFEIFILFHGEDGTVYFDTESGKIDWDKAPGWLTDDIYANPICDIELEYGIESEDEIAEILEKILFLLKKKGEINLIQKFIKDYKELYA